jgi:uncharacterized protein (DUF2249 family)
MSSSKHTDNSKQENLIISPETKIGKLLETYPHLEDLLLDISPEFGKLRNPILRKTIAKVANLKQAAEIGKIPLEDFINQLRQKVGQTNWTNSTANSITAKSAKPHWILNEKVALSIDARPMLEKGEHPIELVLKELETLNENQILELLTPFQPQPLIDLVRNKGHQTWTDTISPNLYKTFIKS